VRVLKSLSLVSGGGGGLAGPGPARKKNFRLFSCEYFKNN